MRRRESNRDRDRAKANRDTSCPAITYTGLQVPDPCCMCRHNWGSPSTHGPPSLLRASRPIANTTLHIPPSVLLPTLLICPLPCRRLPLGLPSRFCRSTLLPRRSGSSTKLPIGRQAPPRHKRRASTPAEHIWCPFLAVAQLSTYKQHHGPRSRVSTLRPSSPWLRHLSKLSTRYSPHEEVYHTRFTDSNLGTASLGRGRAKAGSQWPVDHTT